MTAPKSKKSEPKVMTVRTFCCFPEEWKRWKEAAKSEGRSISSWIRLRLLDADRPAQDPPGQIQTGREI